MHLASFEIEWEFGCRISLKGPTVLSHKCIEECNLHTHTHTHTRARAFVQEEPNFIAISDHQIKMKTIILKNNVKTSP